MVTAAVASGQSAVQPGVAGLSLALSPPVAVKTGVMRPRGQRGVGLRCLSCGQVFTARRCDRHTCSRRCAATPWPSCTTTGTQAEPLSCADADGDTALSAGRSDRGYCSDRCRTRAQRGQQRQSDARHQARSP